MRPTGTVTLLFSDIAGSTRLLRNIGVERYENALQQHRALDAVLAARDAQYSLREHVWADASASGSGSGLFVLAE